MADLRLRVDWIRCDGYGACGDLLPEAIDFDEWRYPILRPGTVERARLDIKAANERLAVTAKTVEQATESASTKACSVNTLSSE